MSETSYGSESQTVSVSGTEDFNLSACKVRHPELLDLLTRSDGIRRRIKADLSTKGPVQRIELHKFPTKTRQCSVFCTESTVNAPLNIVVAMLREIDLTPLAGKLKHSHFFPTGTWPCFHRTFAYTTRFPFPFWARSFEVGSWFIPPNMFPEDLAPESGETVVCYISQTVANRSRVPRASVSGDILFSGVLFIPSPDGERTWMRRVTSVNFNWCFSGWLHNRSVRNSFKRGHRWMNRAAKNPLIVDALRERIARHRIVYDSLLHSDVDNKSIEDLLL